MRRLVRNLLVLAVACGLGCGGGSTAIDGGLDDASVLADGAPGPEAGGDGSGPGDGPGTDAACTPTGATDVPDDQFRDTNCDGIDGDVASAVFVAPDGDDATNDGTSPAGGDIAQGMNANFTDEAACSDGGGGNTLFHNSFNVVFVKNF